MWAIQLSTTYLCMVFFLFGGEEQIEAHRMGAHAVNFLSPKAVFKDVWSRWVVWRALDGRLPEPVCQYIMEYWRPHHTAVEMVQTLIEDEILGADHFLRTAYRDSKFPNPRVAGITRTLLRLDPVRETVITRRKELREMMEAAYSRRTTEDTLVRLLGICVRLKREMVLRC